MKKMKIGLVCPYDMFQAPGGVQEVVFQLQKHMRAKGHEALIITPRPAKHYSDAPEGIITVGKCRRLASPFSTSVDWGLDAYAAEIQEVLDREKFDILNFHEPWQPFISLQILSRSEAVNVGTFHAKLPDTIVSRSLLNLVVPHTTAVLKYIHVFTAVSEAAADYLKELTDAPITIIPNGIDLQRFAKRPKVKRHKQKTILYLGRLEKRKGIKYLIQAFAVLKEKHPDVKLVLAGDGLERENLKKLVAEYQVPDVDFIGYVPEDKKVGLIANADLFCSPAIFGESFGIVLLEAMAIGTPIVCGNNPGYSGVMTGRGRLSLVTPENILDFSQRLELMLYDEEIRRLFIDWGHNHVKQFTFDKIADAYEQVYKKALKKYGRR
jgi:phosphatidylinositol alpha-mannosyltransferase